MKPVLPELHHHLVSMANAPKPRRSPRTRRVVFAGGGALLATATVAAAATLWTPQLGGQNGPPVSAGSTEVPAAQSDRFAALRRPQTDADRNIDVVEALKFLPDTVSGVRVAGVRALGRTAQGQQLVLIPAERNGNVTDALCIWIQDPADGGGFHCSSTEQALDGDLSVLVAGGLKPSGPATDRGSYSTRKVDAAGLKGEVVGLVPDGVSAVGSGRSGSLAETEQGFYSLAVDRVELGSALTWYDADRREVQK